MYQFLRDFYYRVVLSFKRCSTHSALIVCGVYLYIYKCTNPSISTHDVLKQDLLFPHTSYCKTQKLYPNG